MNWFHAVSRFLGQTSPHLTFEVTGVTMFLQWVLVWEKEELGAAGVGVASFPAPSRLLPNAQGRELHTWAGVGDVLLPLIPAPHAGTAPAWGAVQEPFVGQRCLDAALTVTPRPIHLGREPVWGSAQPCLTFSRCTVETATPLPSVP